MKLPHPFVQLPLLFDAGRLEAEIAALGEDVWLPHPQGFAGNSMLPLIACEGSAEDESFAGQMAPTPHLQRCPYLHDTIAALGVVASRGCRAACACWRRRPGFRFACPSWPKASPRASSSTCTAIRARCWAA